MSVRSSAHVHTEFCHGDVAAHVCEAAYEKGFISLGFTSHAPMPYGYGQRAAEPQSWKTAYLQELNRLRQVWAGRIKIYRAIERDDCATLSPHGFDYFIGSVHDLPTSDGGHVSVDGKSEPLRAYIEQECGCNGLALARRYFAAITAYNHAMRPPITGHFDLIRKNNPILHFLDEDSPAYQRLALDALDTLRGSGTLLELNTGGIARGYLPTPYPAPFILKAWREWGGEVILNSDCHDARYLDCYFEEGEALLRALGYNHTVRLGAGDEMWERYKL